MSTINVTEEKYLEIYNSKRESNAWDFKRELNVSSKSGKYNLIKDFLAFANFGGGYILIGIESDNTTIISTANEIDPANLGSMIENTLRFTIDFELAYFNIKDKRKTKKVGLIYVHPSSRILTCPSDLHDENGKIVIREHDIFTRRTTRSIKANTQDLEILYKRINKKKKIIGEKVKSEKLPVFNDNTQRLYALWDAIGSKIEITAEQMGINLRLLLKMSKHNKYDFAKLVGIGAKQFEELLKGEKLPSLDFLLRVCRQVDIEITFFFEPNYLGFKPFWLLDIVRSSILKLISPFSEISKIKNINSFLGSVVYETAQNIFDFHSWIHGDTNSKWNSNEMDKALESFFSLPKDKKNDFRDQLSHQHYKLLEQVVDKIELHGFTKIETIISNWFHCNETYMARIFVEAICKIEIGTDNKPIITFHFWKEMIDKKIPYRSYDAKKVELTILEKNFE